MARGAAYLLTATLAAAPAAAQSADEPDVLAACAVLPVGDKGCDDEALSTALGRLGADDVKVFASYGMESFAILTALRYGASALFFADEGEGCVAEEERAAAIDIWSIWVKLPPDVPKVVADRFAIYDGIMNRIVAMEVGC